VRHCHSEVSTGNPRDGAGKASRFRHPAFTQQRLVLGGSRGTEGGRPATYIKRSLMPSPQLSDDLSAASGDHLSSTRKETRTIGQSYTKMKSILFTTLAAFFAQQVAGHATFQQLWVNGVDQISLPAPWFSYLVSACMNRLADTQITVAPALVSP
jgi:hypothetical protein